MIRPEIEIKVASPRPSTTTVAAYIREGRLRTIGIDRWGWTDENGRVPQGHEGMTRAEFNDYVTAVRLAFDVYEAAATARDAMVGEPPSGPSGGAGGVGHVTR